VTLRIREFSPPEEAEKAKDLLQSLPFVQEVIINSAQGNSLNLVVTTGNDALITIQQSLNSAGLPTLPSRDLAWMMSTSLLRGERYGCGTRQLGNVIRRLSVSKYEIAEVCYEQKSR